MPAPDTVAFDTVVFDIGNVLVLWDPAPAVARDVGAEEATAFLADPAFDFMGWNHLQDAGRDWDEAEAHAIAEHPKWERHIRAYRAHFEHSLVGTLGGTVDLLHELHDAGVRLFALTNWSRELFPLARERYDFLALFDDIVVSGEERLAKPDPAIFEVLRQRVGGSLAGCVFTDDSPRNVAAARAAGLEAILFRDPDQLRGELVARGLPVARAVP